jgi:signal transduction histidine kinase
VRDVAPGESARAFTDRLAQTPLIVRYALALLLVTATTLVSLAVKQLIAPHNLTLLYVLAVVLAASGLGWGPSLATAAASILAFAYFFMAPYYSFRIAAVSDVWTAALLLLICVIVGALAAEARRRGTEKLREAQARAMAVSRIGRAARESLDQLSREPDLNVFLREILAIAARELGAYGGGLWLVEDSNERLLMSLEETEGELEGVGNRAWPGGSALLAKPGAAITRDRIIGHRRGAVLTSTADRIENDPLFAPHGSYLKQLGVRAVITVPLFLGEDCIGSMGLRFRDHRRLTSEEEELAFALANQAVLALELDRLSTVARDAGVLEERNRMAREIHDTLAQGFAAIRLQLDLARGEEGLPSRAATALEFAYQIAGENLVETRRSMAVLKSRQPELAKLLAGAVEGVRRLGSGPVVTAFTAVAAPPNDVAHELVRIAQEAMLNASRHAGAQTIRVTLTPLTDQGLRLAVVDDGKGFDTSRTGSGFGLVGMHERAAAIQAELAIVSEPGAGTEVAVTWTPGGATANPEQA